MFSGVTTSFGRLERGASLMSVRPRLNSANQCIIVDLPDAQSG